MTIRRLLKDFLPTTVKKAKIASVLADVDTAYANVLNV